MAKDKNGKSVKNKIIADVKEELRFIAVAVVFFSLLFLINIPFIFDYRAVPNVGKAFMIIGSASVAVLLVLGAVYWLKKVKEKIPKDIVIAIVIFCLYYAYAILAYFNYDIWGSKIYVSAIVIACIIIHSAYNVVSRFQDFFNGERIIILLIAFAWFFVFLSSAKNTQISETFLKIAVGIVYAISIPCFIRATLFSKRNEARSKHIIFLMMVGIIIGAGIIISFPFYVNWCGLKDNNFTTFVSVYSALVGGGLTLSGVAWTIHKSDKDKKEEEKKKNRPLIFVQSFESLTDKNPRKIINVFIKDNLEPSSGIHLAIKKEDTRYYIHHFYLYNTDFSYCTLKGFIINEEKIIANIGQVLDKDNVYTVPAIKFAFEKDIEFVGLLLQDMLENTYVMELKFHITPDLEDDAKVINIDSCIEIREIEVDYKEEPHA